MLWAFSRFSLKILSVYLNGHVPLAVEMQEKLATKHKNIKVLLTTVEVTKTDEFHGIDNWQGEAPGKTTLLES